VTSNPAHTDGLSQADSHMRLLKSTLKATFPNFTSGALASTQAQLDAAVAGRFALGTALLPGLTPTGDTNTGIFSPAADQIGVSLGGTQVLLMAGTALVTSLGIGAAAVASTGAYSGGTGQLVPVGGTLIWWDDVLPTEGGYAWANGQVIASANTVCPVLLARWGSRFGGNGTTTMGVPDLRDAVPVGKSTMGAVASRGLQTLANTVLGTLIGAANVVLTTLNLPPYTPSGTLAGTNSGSLPYVHTNANNSPGGATPALTDPMGTSFANQNLSIAWSGSFTGTPQGGTSTAVNNVQPSATCNYIIRLA
jgi:microcystin-dependent protein